MILISKRSHLAELVIAASVVGYPVASVLAKLVDIDNQLVSIVIRGFVAACALFLFIGRMSARPRLALTLFTVFWTAYLLRLGYTFGLVNETASNPASDFVLWSVGVCIIPSLPILLYNGKINFARTGGVIAVLGLIAMIGIILLGGTAFETAQGVITDQNRWNLSTINPISIGHLGASLVIVGSAAMLYGKPSGPMYMFHTGIVIVGVVGLFLANSRGPLVALMIVMILYGFAQIRNRRTWRYSILVLLAGLILVYRNAGIIFGARGLFDRFGSLLTGQDKSALVRYQLYTDGFAQFLNSPLVGDGVEVRTLAYYPHNAVLEAFMTTGIIGGSAFLIFTFLSLRESFRIMRYDSGMAVVAMLTIQYIIAAQFSGAIYQWGAMWVLMALVLSFRPSPKLSKKGLSQHRQQAGWLNSPFAT